MAFLYGEHLADGDGGGVVGLGLLAFAGDLVDGGPEPSAADVRDSRSTGLSMSVVGLESWELAESSCSCGVPT